MLLATVAMAVITAIGVYYVWRTLKATQDMARDTRDIGQAQTRAYVSVINVYGQRTPGGTGVQIVATIKNTGSSPALGMQANITTNVVKSYQDKKVTWPKPDNGTIQTDLGAGETRTVSTDCDNLTFDIVDWLTEETGERIFCFIYVTYFDVFNKKKTRRTIVSSVHSGRYLDTGNLLMSACERGNRST
jgi:hypothetical protein